MVDKDAVRKAYDELADLYAAQRYVEDRGMEILTEFLASLSPSDYVLNADCGQGAAVLSRLRESTTTIGADFSCEQLRLAADTAPDASLIQMT